MNLNPIPDDLDVDELADEVTLRIDAYRAQLRERFGMATALAVLIDVATVGVGAALALAFWPTGLGLFGGVLLAVGGGSLAYRVIA